jgi:hypothetical protein
MGIQKFTRRALGSGREGNGMEYFEFKPDSSAKAEASLFLGYHSQVAALI